jgi:hypothetical protein
MFFERKYRLDWLPYALATSVGIVFLILIVTLDMWAH